MAERKLDEDERGRGVYAISVAAELVGTAAANLRAYERAGLLEPSRTEGGSRLYSPNDITRLRRITELLNAGVNLTGVAMVLDLQDDNQQLHQGAAIEEASQQPASTPDR